MANVTKKSIAADPMPVFRERFRDLVDKEGGQSAFAAKVGLSRQSVGFWYNSTRTPDAESLLQIANACNVPIDWLLGHGNFNNSSTDQNVYEMAEYTGLSSCAIESLHTWADKEPHQGFHINWNKRQPRFISYLIENEDGLLDSLMEYMRLNKKLGNIEIRDLLHPDPETGDLPLVTRIYGDTDLFMVLGDYAQPINFDVLEKTSLVSVITNLEKAKETLWNNIGHSQAEKQNDGKQ